MHTDIGNACVGAKINNRLAALSEPLQSGQLVEVITAAKAQPHPGWLDFVLTAKARSAIRHNLKNRQHDDSVRLGRRLLNKVLSSVSLSLDDMSEECLQECAAFYQLESFEKVLEQIGMGDRQAWSVAKNLVAEERGHEISQQLNSPVMIDSSEGQVISFGGCCRPIPGDPIVGHFSGGRGMVIHQENCKNISDVRSDPEKCTPVVWAPQVTGEFQAEIWVEVEMFRGIVAELASRITSCNAGIDHIGIEERGASLSVLKVHLRVTGRKHLATIIKRIRLIPAVKSIRRGRNN